MKIFLIFGIAWFYLSRIFPCLWQKIKKKNIKKKELNNLNKKIFFFVVDILGLLIIILQIQGKISFKNVFLKNYFFQNLGYFLFSIGLLLSSYARIYLKENWDTAANSGIKEKHQLITSGPYSFSRHPIYIGSLYYFLGLEILLGSWLILLGLPLIILIEWESSREEKLLIQKFPEYQIYQKKVRKF